MFFSPPSSLITPSPPSILSKDPVASLSSPRITLAWKWKCQVMTNMKTSASSKNINTSHFIKNFIYTRIINVSTGQRYPHFSTFVTKLSDGHSYFFRFMSYLYCSFLLFPCGLTISYRMKSFIYIVTLYH